MQKQGKKFQAASKQVESRPYLLSDAVPLVQKIKFAKFDETVELHLRLGVDNEGWTDFDAVISTPDMMRSVGKLGKVLGPRGLMPNPKTGTVTTDIANAVREVKAGKVEFRVDKTGVIHVGVGKVSFETPKLLENASSLIQAVIKAKPAAAKGKYVKSVTICSTMGPGVHLDVTAFNAKQV